MTEKAAEPISGQWVGQSSGDPAATIVMDLDPIGDNANGVAYLYPHDPATPCSRVTIEIPNRLDEVELEADVVHFDGFSGYTPFTYSELSTRYPEINLPRKATIKLVPKDSNTLIAHWHTEVGSFGDGQLSRAEPPEKSKLASEAEVSDWRIFQEYVTEKLEDGLIFRGQSECWPLQSSFHRTSRRELSRYLREDIPRLHRALSGRTKHVFDLNQPQENGAFLSLAQHHGFPTPLLDWTYSPFVAAYFAFSNAKKRPANVSVRILAFDQRRYRERFPELQTLTNTRPHFSVLEALAIENERVGPQQGLLTLTNMTDIEGFLEYQERISGERYLWAFDLPSAQAEKALRDLRLMGITRATLFPGIDSICRELRYRHF